MLRQLAWRRVRTWWRVQTRWRRPTPLRKSVALGLAALLLLGSDAVAVLPGHDGTPPPRALPYPVAARPAHETTVAVGFTKPPRSWRPVAGMSSAATGPAAPFGQCPAVGAATGCAVLLEVTGDGRAAIRADPDQFPFDGSSGATLVGVLNSSPAPVRALTLAADTELFAFTGGGICAGHDPPTPRGCRFGDTGFEGPGVEFTGVGADRRTGTVRFDRPIRQGGTAYFALAQSPAPTVPAAGSATRAELGGDPSPSLRTVACGAADVNCATGVLRRQFTDISVEGRGVPLRLTRTYSSARAGVPSRFGYGWVDSYDLSLTVAGGTVTVHEENGAAVEFTATAGGGFTAPARVLATLSRDPDGRYRFTRHGTGVHHLFDASGRLVEQRDGNDAVTRLSYAGDGDPARLVEVADAAGRKLTFTYDGPYVQRVDGPGRQSWSYRYDNGNLVAATEVEDHGSRTFGYDGHRLVRETLGREGTWRTWYGPADRVARQEDPTGGETRWEYRGDGASAGGGSTTMTNATGDVTVLTYADLRLTEVTRGAGTADAATTRYTYGPATLVSSMTDGNGHVTRYRYDAEGNPTTVTDARGYSTVSRYEHGRLVEVGDPLGHVKRYGYDDRGNPLWSADASGNVTTYERDPKQPGDLIRIVDPLKRHTAFTYDAWGTVRTVTVYPAADRPSSVQYVHDAAGLLRSTVDGSAVTSVEYNRAGRPTKITDPALHTTTIGYDDDGNAVSTLDRNNNLTRHDFDAAGRPLRVTMVGDNGGTSTGTGYDAAGRPQRQLDPAGRVTGFGYDGLGRVTTMRDPLGRTTRLGYDRVGNITAIVDPAGRTTSLTYDKTDNLLSVTYSDGVTRQVAFEYDAAGRRTSMRDGTGLTRYGYDDDDRLTEVTDGAGTTVGYHYDPAGQQDEIRYPAGTVRRTFDGTGRITSVKDWKERTTSFEYGPAGNLTKKTYPNGVTTTYEPSIVERRGGEQLAGYEYARDWTGQVNSATTTSGTGAKTTVEYGYDKSNRLDRVGGRALTYDGAGNLTGLPDGTTQQFDEAGQLTASTYDQQGNRLTAQTSDGTVRLGYDQANRLVTVGSDVAYTYDGDGQRTSVTRRGDVANLTWDRSASTPVLLGDGTDTYVYGPDGVPVEQLDADGNASFLHTDGQGSVRLLTDKDGTVTGRRDYDAFGRTLNATGTVPALGYRGQYTDKETGFQYLQARYYDPATAQFLTRDPLLTTTRAPYSYAGNNPVNAADPSGLNPFDPRTWFAKGVRLLRAVVAPVVRFVADLAKVVVASLGDLVGDLVTGVCEAAVGIATGGAGLIAAAGACGALGGAIGGAIDYLVAAIQTGEFSWSGLGGATWEGAWQGALAGFGGKAVTVLVRYGKRLNTRPGPPVRAM
ncbi:RHS repeat-associated core domain-containing protein [Dactylosporangium sp. NPDC049525]|uniref:RHS repeat-associated core domain-containing protein n=1 Tax=Dactylosporangium sp. NPDC049525 TaxID=3154730 RepID=UPI003435300C